MRLSQGTSILFLFNISIHAPLTGCDTKHCNIIYQGQDFNPRTPYGMRLGNGLYFALVKIFQSTHPLRDATMAKMTLTEQAQISIHAPLTGCDNKKYV